MNLYKKIRRKVIFSFYRLMREDMVIRMRVNGFTWTKINSVLRVLGQKQIVRIEKKSDRDILTYGYIARKVVRYRDKHGWKTKMIEPSPEIINKNDL